MAREPRIHFPGALYHVIARGNWRKGIFLDERDLRRFLTHLSDWKKRFPFRLDAHALLKNQSTSSIPNPAHRVIEAT
jgi:REP element-mobilizing transposase RayT